MGGHGRPSPCRCGASAICAGHKERRHVPRSFPYLNRARLGQISRSCDVLAVPLLKELQVDPHVRAEQMGHTIDASEDVYTITSLKRRKEAVNAPEKSIGASRTLLHSGPWNGPRN